MSTSKKAPAIINSQAESSAFFDWYHRLTSGSLLSAGRDMLPLDRTVLAAFVTLVADVSIVDYDAHRERQPRSRCLHQRDNRL